MQLTEVIKDLPALFAALFTAILFVQSGLDKAFDWKGNREWLTGHFSKTVFSRRVPVLLAVLTVMELVTGVIAAVGLVKCLVTGETDLIFAAAVAGAATLTALFFGQRLAKDYPGAAVLVPYFLLMLAMMYFSRTV